MGSIKEILDRRTNIVKKNTLTLKYLTSFVELYLYNLQLNYRADILISFFSLLNNSKFSLLFLFYFSNQSQSKSGEYCKIKKEIRHKIDRFRKKKLKYNNSVKEKKNLRRQSEQSAIL